MVELESQTSPTQVQFETRASDSEKRHDLHLSQVLTPFRVSVPQTILWVKRKRSFRLTFLTMTQDSSQNDSGSSCESSRVL